MVQSARRGAHKKKAPVASALKGPRLSPRARPVEEEEEGAQPQNAPDRCRFKSGYPTQRDDGKPKGKLGNISASCPLVRAWSAEWRGVGSGPGGCVYT